MARASAGHRALIDVLLGLQNSAPLRDRLERSWPWSATTISDRRRRSWWTAGVYPSRLNANSRILCMKLDWLAAARHESTAFPLWWGAIKVLVTRPLKLSEWVFINNWSSFAFERESEVSKGAISTRGFFRRSSYHIWAWWFSKLGVKQRSAFNRHCVEICENWRRNLVNHDDFFIRSSVVTRAGSRNLIS